MITKDHKYWMTYAITQAKQALIAGEVPIGAVIIKNNQLIASGYNQPIKSKNTTSHAEIVSITKACKLLDNYRLDNCQIYVTLKPCMMCLGAIFNARISDLVYGADDIKKNNLYHTLKITGGVLEVQCSKILNDFFKSKRV